MKFEELDFIKLIETAEITARNIAHNNAGYYDPFSLFQQNPGTYNKVIWLDAIKSTLYTMEYEDSSKLSYAVYDAAREIFDFLYEQGVLIKAYCPSPYEGWANMIDHFGIDRKKLNSAKI